MTSREQQIFELGLKAGLEGMTYLAKAIIASVKVGPQLKKTIGDAMNTYVNIVCGQKVKLFKHLDGKPLNSVECLENIVDKSIWVKYKPKFNVEAVVEEILKYEDDSLGGK